jgi:hydroxymethylpyrimidine/phosphomethylpyrimidine kinase
MLGTAEIVGAAAGALDSPCSRSRCEGRGQTNAAAPLIRRFAPPSPRVRGDGSGAFIVYDPVMMASSGEALSRTGFIEAVRRELMPLVDCLTPNLAEAATLLDEEVAESEDDMARQGAALRKLGPRAALIKGGHLDGDKAVDLLVTAEGVRRYATPRIASPNLHGTGCTLSSAIAANVVLGMALPDAVAAAKTFVGNAIERGRRVRLGAGNGPLIQAKLS